MENFIDLQRSFFHLFSDFAASERFGLISNSQGQYCSGPKARFLQLSDLLKVPILSHEENHNYNPVARS